MRTFDYGAVNRPDFFQENRDPPHSDHEYLLAGGQSPRFPLNGPWYFHYAENYQQGYLYLVMRLTESSAADTFQKRPRTSRLGCFGPLVSCLFL